MLIKCLLLLVLSLQLAASQSSCLDSPQIALPKCANCCGNVSIPYPFGIGPGCFHSTEYEIRCDNSTLKPFLEKFNNLEVLEINWDGKYGQFVSVRSPTLSMCTGNSVQKKKSIDFRGTPYRYSTWYNVFVVEGCGGTVMLKNRTGHILTGCASVCATSDFKAAAEDATDCYGVGCCQATFLLSSNSDDGDSYIEMNTQTDLEFYELDVESENDEIGSHDVCNLAATLSDNLSMRNRTMSGGLSDLPMVLEWSATYLDIHDVDLDNVSCHSKKCSCHLTYEGNPYLPHGCQVVKECRRCRKHCSIKYRDQFELGVFYCKNPLLQLGPILGFSLGVGLVLLFLFIFWLYRFIKRKREVKRKAKYFKRNGGLLLLQQQASPTEDAFKKTKIFRITELEKATDKFNKNRILGQGGQGTVYKGMLIDGKIVAIKKSKQVDESQLESFITEVVILSQINHRNVVRILGCCLETEVPLLVYEFIPNGTLYQHINDPGQEFHVTWKMRLQIAAESADAIAYLHSSSSIPIYHRDIKSSNILLDEKYRAKVSDFGASKAITIDQTHVTTCVIGTYGYLDPEYFQSNQFNEKSDVYSFGVVLVELISGKKPICPTKGGGWISLASEFLSHMETSSLEDILDKRILEEGKEEEFIGIANLAKRCLNMNGKLRPTMKEIAVILNGIRSPDYVPNSKEPYYVESKCVVSEISQPHSAPFGIAPFHHTMSLAHPAPLKPNHFYMANQ